MNPTIDWHAFAPEIVLVATILIVLIADLLLPNRAAWQTSRIAGGRSARRADPVLTLAVDGQNRSMFGGAYVVDNYALAFKGFFLVVGTSRSCSRSITSTRATTTRASSTSCCSRRCSA